MREVAIIGAGELGGLVAHTVARSAVVPSIRLIDANGAVAGGKALDIMQAAPLEGFATTVAGSNDLFSAAGADIVVIADPAAGESDWFADAGVTLLRRLRSFAGDALFVCAGASHRELVERGVRELGFSRARIVGSAAEALNAAARALVALELNASPADVTLTVLGIPPRVVIGWSDAAIAGFALTRRLTEPARRRLTDRIAALWPVAPYVLAAAAGKVVEMVAGRSRRLAVCFVAPDDSAGVRTRTAAVPVRLGPAGILEIVLPELPVNERVALENAMLL